MKTREDYLDALRDFNAAAQHLSETWEQYNHGDAAVGYPEFLPSFDEACHAFAEWTGAEEQAGEDYDAARAALVSAAAEAQEQFGDDELERWAAERDRAKVR